MNKRRVTLTELAISTSNRRHLFRRNIQEIERELISKLFPSIGARAFKISQGVDKLQDVSNRTEIGTGTYSTSLKVSRTYKYHCVELIINWD